MATGIKYIGKSENYADRIYGTGIKFDPGQVYSVEDGVAKKMLQHTDTYAVAAIPKGTKMTRVTVEVIDERRDDPPMMDFSRMSDRDLRGFARLHYNQALPPHAGRQTMIDKLVTLSHLPR